MTERQYYLWLRLVPDLGPQGHRKLLLAFGSAKGIYEAEEATLQIEEIKTFGEKVLQFRQIDGGRQGAEKRILDYEERLRLCGVDYIALSDPDYPERLKQIYDPPIVLFYRGRKELLKQTTAIAIVGARNPSVYGKESARYFAAELAKKEVTIISGMAAGIDAQSHWGSLKAKGNTIAVLGSGINVCYPTANYPLYEELCKNQLVLSENGLEEPPLAFYFPLRNRIISGLSQGVLVVEARQKSGSLITADCALEQGKNVYALPGRAFDKLSEGTNHLIKMGAALADCPEDILQDLFYEEEKDSTQAASGKQNKELSALEKKVYAQLSLEPVYIDDIVAQANCSVSEVLHILLGMEKRGIIKQPVRGYYIVSL